MEKYLKTNCYCTGKKTEFLKWAMELLAPVIMGVKPAEILSFPNSNEAEEHKRNIIKERICEKDIRYIEFSYCPKCTKLFIYNVRTLDITLRDARNHKFLKTLGYPEGYSLEGYVNHLMNSLKQGKIPDEIGVFLGYPLKDVMGFMGHPSLKLTKINGWRVYGNERLSDERFSQFTMAKMHIRSLLDNWNPQSMEHLTTVQMPY